MTRHDLIYWEGSIWNIWTVLGYRISGYFQGCIFHKLALIFNFMNFNFTNDYYGSYPSNTCEVFQFFF